MKYVLLVMVILAWIYSLYAFKKANPSNGYEFAWCIFTVFWGVFIAALLSA